jgi:hypothetical protein
VSLRVLLLIVCCLTTAGAAHSAPAPLPKSARHPPTPDTLLANFRAEGYSVRMVERGPEPGTYRVTTSAPDFQLTTFTVRADDPDVRGAIREELESARRAYQESLRGRFEKW